MDGIMITHFTIHTEFVHPPFPGRKFDWAAYRADYSGIEPMGRGETELAAIKDLLELEELSK
jgi:hypothetical protein